MEDTDEEKVKLLESIRLQDAALSVVVHDNIATFDSDSEVDQDSEEDTGLLHIKEDHNSSLNELDINALVEEESSSSNTDTNNDNPTWAEALEANQEYDAVLAQLEADIKQNLAKVVKQLKEVQDNIQNISTNERGLSIKSQFIYTFGMPYFKTENFYPCPYNPDYHTKKNNREILWPDLEVFHQWVTRHKKTLNEAVSKLAFQKCVKDAKLKLAFLRKELELERASGRIERVTEIEQEIRDFKVQSVAQSMLEDEIANGEHDWMKISATYLEGKQSAESCKSFWNLYLHPKINKTPYTEDEESKLLELATKYKFEDWDKIAEELGTNRSGYQCFIVYQNKLNLCLKRNTWEPWEDKKLLKSVEKHRIGDFIPWGKVSYDMENRTKTQIFNRWTYSINPAIKKGRFTEEEDIMILAGVQMWGEDFQRISNFMKDRTTCQVRDRYKHYLSKQGLTTPWTPEDDARLMDLAEKHGRKWATICKWFPSKDRTQVRHRFNTLSRWKAKNPGVSLDEAPARTFYPNSTERFWGQWNKAQAILKCDSLEEMVKAKNELVSSLTERQRRTLLKVSKKKKQSPIEADLVNYFRCSYELPGGPRKVAVRKEEAKRYAKELSLLFKLFKLKLNLPSIEDIEADNSLTGADKEILTNLLLDTIDFDSEVVPKSEILEESTSHLEDSRNTTTQLFVDVETEPFENDPLSDESLKNIDYVPSHNYSSLYIDLPLMNFTNDQVVADRNQDPSFFEPPCRQRNTFDTAMSSPVKGEEIYIFPPNLTTLVGMRTFLLNRRHLITWCNKHLDKEDLSGVSNVKLEEAKKKFDERIFCLFLWPALMSRYRPNDSSTVFDDEENEPVTVPNPVPIRRQKSKKVQENREDTLQQDIIINSESNNGINLQSTSRDGSYETLKKTHDPSVPSTSGVSTKRRRIIEMESDDDPDDPDIVLSKDSYNQSYIKPHDPSVPSTSGVSTKRRKIIEMESDDDPDDPDIVPSKDGSNQAYKKTSGPSEPGTSGVSSKGRKIIKMESDDDPDDPDIV